MCSKHYIRFMQHGDPHHVSRMKRAGECMVERCGRPVHATRLCSRHYEAQRRAVRAEEECRLAGCARGVFSSGLCKKHYAESIAKEYDFTCVVCGLSERRKLNSNGNKTSTCGPNCKSLLIAQTKQYGGSSRISVSVRERNVDEFLRLIKSRTDTNEHGCWVWSGFLDKNGYGNTRCNSQTWYAHRLVAHMVLTNYSESLPVHHVCANRACCNPDHLRVVTPQENSAEMMERNHYLRRIAELERVVLELAPGHEVLSRAPSS